MARLWGYLYHRWPVRNSWFPGYERSNQTDFRQIRATLSQPEATFHPAVLPPIPETITTVWTGMLKTILYDVAITLLSSALFTTNTRTVGNLMKFTFRNPCLGNPLGRITSTAYFRWRRDVGSDMLTCCIPYTFIDVVGVARGELTSSQMQWSSSIHSAEATQNWVFLYMHEMSIRIRTIGQRWLKDLLSTLLPFVCYFWDVLQIGACREPNRLFFILIIDGSPHHQISRNIHDSISIHQMTSVLKSVFWEFKPCDSQRHT